ncbi:hypothetical protein [Fischerella muscicola]
MHESNYQELNLPTQPLDVATAIFQRRCSIKTFKPDPISPEL